MEGIALKVGAVILVAIVVALGYFLMANPLDARRLQLAAELAEIKPIEVDFHPPDWDFEAWERSIAEKPALWEELVEPPPPPKPPPPKPPNLGKMIAGVSASRQQIGKKAKIITKNDPRGAFMAVGDVVGGLTIKEITKTEVILVLKWQGKELTTSLPRN